MRTAIVIGLFVALALSQTVDLCAYAPDCLSCRLRVDSAGKQCQWCAKTSSGNSFGCAASGKCPSSTSPVSSCSADVGSCTAAPDCQSCVRRVSPAQVGSRYQNTCQWCTSYDGDIGCRPYGSCPSSSSVYTSYCPTSNDGQGYKVSLAVSIVIFLVGLLLGALVYFITSNKDAKEQFRASIFLYVMSYFFWGAAYWSAFISFRLLRNEYKKSCCSCKCSWMYICGVIELLGVTAGFLTGVSMDGIFLGQIQQGWSQNYYYNPNWTLLIGMPTVLASILCFGLPRVLIGSCLVKPRQVPTDDAEETRLLQSEQPPIAAPAHNSAVVNAQPPAGAAPPRYYSPHNQSPVAQPTYQAAPPPAYTYQPNPALTGGK